MYWSKRTDFSRSLEVELLEARGSTSSIVERNEESLIEEEEEKSEDLEEVTTKKRSNCNISRQLRKKQSISNINQLTIEDSISLEPQTFVSEETLQPAQSITMAAAPAFNHNETWNRIKQLSVTSKHYTARDKNELIAQEPTFAALDDLIAFSQTIINDQAKKNRIDHMINNAISQLKLYYFVGTEGWATAIATIKATEAARLGLPEPTREQKPQIIHVHSKTNYQSYNGYKQGYKKEKNYGRHSYKKN